MFRTVLLSCLALALSGCKATMNLEILPSFGDQATLGYLTAEYDNQSGTVGTALASPFAVIVKDSTGTPVSGVQVRFEVAGNALATGSVFPAVSVTDINGRAETVLTLGHLAAGGHQVNAFTDSYGTISFNATAVAAAPLNFITFLGGSLFNTGDCTSVTVQQYDQYSNLVSNNSTPTSLTVTGDSSIKYFSTPADCSNPAATALSSLQIPATSPAVVFYARFKNVGSQTISFTNSNSVAVDVAPIVEPLYATNGSNWNDYVKFPSTAAEKYSSALAPCPAGALDYRGCLNGGEYKKVVLHGITSCTGLTGISDDEGWFDWEACTIPNVGDSATFISKGLKPWLGLKTVLNSSGFKQNRIMVSGNSMRSNYAQWWSNPVVILASNTTSVQILNSIGTIYVVPSFQYHHGFNIDADKISLVTLDGASINYQTTQTGAAANTCDTNGEFAGASSRCLIAAGSQKYLWIEVHTSSDFGSNDAHYGMYLYEITHSRINDSAISKSAWGNVYIASSRKNLFSRLLSFRSQGSGLYLDTSDHNKFETLRVHSSSSEGIFLNGAQINTFGDVISTNNVGYGFYLSASHQNKIRELKTFNNSSGLFVISSNENSITDFLGVGNEYSGIYMSGADRNNIVQATIAQNSDVGTHLYNSSENIFHHLISSANLYGVRIYQGTQNTFTQLVATNNSAYAVSIESTNSNRFAGNFLTDSSGSCSWDTLGSDQGLGVGCIPTTSSTANVVFGKDLSATFFPITSDDTINQSDATGGLAMHDSISDLDRYNFQHPYRSWGHQGTTAFATSMGRCISGQTCKIWDWSLNGIDTMIQNRSGDGVNPNTAFPNASSGACPAQVHGNITATSIRSAANTYLLNAIEVMYDAFGNDNGLCENGEKCMYAPHYGAYQGSDIISNSCVFNANAGAITTATIYGRSYY